MFRIITAKKLEAMEAHAESLRLELVAAKNHTFELHTRLSLIGESRDYFKNLAATWERRACRFIDQVGIKSDTISAQAMTDPVPPPQSGTRQVMTALATSEIHKGKPSPPMSQATEVLGVNEDAAREAVSFVLGR